MYIREKFVNNETFVCKSGDDIIWVKLDKTILSLNSDLYICLCYVTPDDSSRQSLIETNIFDRLMESMVSVENKTQNNCNFLICGDFNSRSSDNPDFVIDDDPTHISVLPDDYTPDNFMQRFSEDQGHTNNNGLYLLDFCKQTGMRIMNGRVGEDYGIGKYTFVGHRGCSVVDYVLAKPELFDFITHFKVHEPNILSDHCLLTFSFEFGVIEEVNMQSDRNENVKGKYKWKKELKKEFIDEIENDITTKKLSSLNEKISDCINSDQIKYCLSELVEILDTAAKPFFKKTQKSSDLVQNIPNGKEKPWYTNECHDKRFTFLYMLDKYRDSNSEQNRKNMAKARSEYKTLLRKCRYKHDKNNTDKLICAKFKNAKEYWNMLKELSHVKPANIPLSSFEQYFKAVNNPTDPFYIPDEDVLYFNEQYAKNEFDIIFDELNLDFTQEEVLNAIKQLKLNKSGGPDYLINEFLIYGKHIFTNTLCKLFNKIFETGCFPDEWTEGFIIPLHKKGSLTDVGNYRGITLLSILGKLFTRVLNNRLKDWAENYHLLIEAQAGFRAGMSTTDNIFVLHGVISHLINQGKKLYCAFVDFTKAFDYVVRENLWYKMIKYGIRGKILNVIKSMYSSVKSRVKYNNQLGNNFYCGLGVRQGECLSPLLFSLFLNDIEEHFIQAGMEGIDIITVKMFMLLYADDIVLFGNSAEQLQDSLNLLSNYCKRWKLTVNINKTKVMVFRKGGALPRNLTFLYNGNELEIVRNFKYLGIIFTAGGSFSETQNTLSGQAQKAIFKINKYLYRFTFISPKHKLELFDKLVTPILNYGSEVWGFIQGNAIERVHLQFCKQLLGVKKTTQNDFVYGELGRTTLITKRYLNIVKYWFKILASGDRKYINIVYRMMLRDMDLKRNSVNWASLIKHLLMSLGFYDVWLAQGVGDYNVFILTLKQRLSDNFIQNWHSRLESSSRATFYSSVAIFQLQPYLEKINVVKFQKAVSRLRVASHRLEIEAGRWARPNRIPINDRICRVCKVLEDEYHFVIECRLYEELRNKHIPKYYWLRPSMLKFVQLMKSDKVKLIRNVSQYILHAFKLRSEIMYRA